jgi:hypothetical protein
VELIREIIVTKEIMLEDFRKQRNSCGMCIHALHHWWRMSSRAIIGEDKERVWYCGCCCGCGLKKIVL